jgi:hypothetical protein
MLVHSIEFFDHSKPDVLLWLTYEEFQKVSDISSSLFGFFLLQQLEVVALF